MSELLTVKEAAKELDVSPRRVHQFCKSGRLGKQYGWQWLITREELEEFKKIPRTQGRPRKED
jgi:excisionase family DNA binding protein